MLPLFFLRFAVGNVAHNLTRNDQPRSGGHKGVLEYLASALLTTILLYFVFWIGAIGAGDVKMLGVCAGFFPWNKVLKFLFFALMIAAVIALFKMYLERNMKDRLYYLGEYLWDVFRCGRWKLYFAGEREGAGAGICMAGPVFCSALMYMGGMY